MKNNDHILALVESTPDPDPTLDIVREAVDRGARATVLVVLTDFDRMNIKAFAESEDLSQGEAEAIYIDQTAVAYAELAGGDRTSAHVIDRSRSGRFVLDTATRSHATSIAVSNRIARGRSWRRAMASAPIPVTIAPSRAA